MEYGFLITRRGQNLIAKLQGDPFPSLNITRVMVGSGLPEADTNLYELNDLVRPVAQATSTPPTVRGNVVSFVVQYRSDMNGGLANSFYLSEFGVYAQDPEAGEEILLYYGTLGDYAQPVMAFDGGSFDTRQFPVSIIVTDQVNVVLSYPAAAFITAEELDHLMRTLYRGLIEGWIVDLVAQHNIAPDAHPDIRAAVKDLGGRVSQLELALDTDITTNPFAVTFGSLDGLVFDGVWNQAAQRAEW